MEEKIVIFLDELANKKNMYYDSYPLGQIKEYEKEKEHSLLYSACKALHKNKINLSNLLYTGTVFQQELNAYLSYFHSKLPKKQKPIYVVKTTQANNEYISCLYYKNISDSKDSNIATDVFLKGLEKNSDFHLVVASEEWRMLKKDYQDNKENSFLFSSVRCLNSLGVDLKNIHYSGTVKAERKENMYCSYFSDSTDPFLNQTYAIETVNTNGKWKSELLSIT